jgi:hypothetical protein
MSSFSMKNDYKHRSNSYYPENSRSNEEREKKRKERKEKIREDEMECERL